MGNDRAERKLSCLFIPTNYPSAGDPFGGIIYVPHLNIACSVFQKVAALSNMYRTKGVEIRRLAGNAVLYEGASAARSLGKIDTPVMIMKSLLRGLRSIRACGIDIIVAHGLRWAGFIGALLSSFTRRPLLLFIHSTAPQDRKSRLLTFITAYAIRHSRKVFFMSSGQALGYTKSFPVGDPVIIGNPVDADTFTISPPEADVREVRIVFAGRPTPDKGFPLLLDIIERLAAVRDDISFTLLTDLRLLSKVDADRLAQIARIDLRHYQEKAEFARILNSSSFLLCLSRFESFSYVIAEAMACGKPVVATECDGPRDLLNENNGVLVPIDNAEEAYRAVLWMIEHHRKYDPRSIREDIVSRFSYNAVRARLEQSLAGMNP